MPPNMSPSGLVTAAASTMRPQTTAVEGSSRPVLLLARQMTSRSAAASSPKSGFSRPLSDQIRYGGINARQVPAKAEANAEMPAEAIVRTVAYRQASVAQKQTM